MHFIKKNNFHKIYIKQLILFISILFITAVPVNIFAAEDNPEQITIGITYTSNTGNYESAVEKAGAIAYKLPLVTTKEAAKKELSKIDALIISGGSDITPAYYGEEESDKLENTSPERDISDLLMLKAAQEQDMPVLGICRGMQIMNVSQGGTLYQDISSEYADVSDDVTHRNPNKGQDITHDVCIDEGSILYDAVKVGSLNIVSRHHQAVKDLGKHLKITARSEDGIIEAIEFTNQEYMAGVQFHPEIAVVKNDESQLGIFTSLKEQGEKYRGKTLERLSAPSLAASVLYGHDNVKVYWDMVDNATGYSVYYKKASSGTYELLKRVSDPVLKTGDLTDGVKYNFKIVPYIKRGTKFYEISDYAETSIYTMKKIETPSLVKHSDSQANISWKDISGQSGYQISRSTSSTGTNIISTWGTVSGTSKIINYGQTIGRPYYYKVRAYKTVSGEKIYGPWSNTVKYTRQLPAPESVKAELYGHDDITVTWSKVNGASGYAVYYKKSSSGTYGLMTRTTSLTVKKADLTDGARYYFKVVPYYKSGDNRYYSDNYRTANVYTLKKMSVPAVSKYSGTHAAVKWKDIYGQSGYQISRAATSTGTYIICTWGTTAGTSKNVKCGTAGKTYYYKIRAYKTVGEDKIYGPWSDSVKHKQ